MTIQVAKTIQGEMTYSGTHYQPSEFETYYELIDIELDRIDNDWTVSNASDTDFPIAKLQDRIKATHNIDQIEKIAQDIANEL